jgi:hypothetical protein
MVVAAENVRRIRLRLPSFGQKAQDALKSGKLFSLHFSHWIGEPRKMGLKAALWSDFVT